MGKVIKQQIKSYYDHLPLSVLVLKPEGTPRGLLHIAHGMCEHKERYEEFMNEMCRNGYICVIHDHRGHGESVRSKEDLGYFYDDSGTYIVEDLHQVIVKMKERYPGLPCYLLGHSMGSMVVRTYVKKYDYEIDGLIVCGSPSRNSMARLGRLLVRMMISLKGEHYRSRWIQNMAFSSYGKKFHEHSEHAWICTVKEVVAAYDQDEYCNFIFTLNGFVNLFSLMIQTYDDENWIMRHKDLPILFIAGSEDPCIVNERKFHQAVDFMKRVGYRHVQSRLYDGKRHEILNEDIRFQVYRDICNWLESL